MWLVLQVDKLYDEKDEDYDPREKDEEIARMREHVMTEVSENLSGYSCTFFRETKFKPKRSRWFCITGWFVRAKRAND